MSVTKIVVTRFWCVLTMVFFFIDFAAAGKMCRLAEIWISTAAGKTGRLTETERSAAGNKNGRQTEGEVMLLAACFWDDTKTLVSEYQLLRKQNHDV